MAIDRAVLEQQTTAAGVGGLEADLDLGRSRRLWHGLAAEADLPREDEPVRRLPGDDAAPVALEAMRAALEAAPADVRLDADPLEGVATQVSSRGPQRLKSPPKVPNASSAWSGTV